MQLQRTRRLALAVIAISGLSWLQPKPSFARDGSACGVCMTGGSCPSAEFRLVRCQDLCDQTDYTQCLGIPGGWSCDGDGSYNTFWRCDGGNEQ